MNKYDLQNASVTISYNDFNKIIKELNDLREFVRTVYWHSETPMSLSEIASELNELYKYWL